MAGLLNNLMWNAVEATLLALVVAAVVRLAKLRAPARHVLWLMVLLKLLVPPIAIHSFGLSGICTSTVEKVRAYAIQWPAQTLVADPDRLFPSDSFDRRLTASLSQSQEVFEITMADGPAESADLLAIEQSEAWLTESLVEAPPIAEGPSEDLPSAGLRDVSPAVVTATGAVSFWNRLTVADLERGLIWFWAAGSLGLLAIRVKQCAAVLRLVRNAEAAPSSVVTGCREVARRFDLARVPPVRIVERSLSPTVCVLRRTTILLPAELVKRCGSHVVRSVLAHELAHVKRRDHWMCWVELLGSCLYWWHPVFWWARHEMRRAADEASDAWAVSVLGCRRQYAESLLQTVELLVADRAVAAAWCPALGQRDTIARRLTMIMKEPLSRSLSWPAWLGVAIVGLLVLPAAPLRSGAQDPPTPPPSVPSDDEITAAVEAFDAAIPQLPREPGAGQPPSRDRRPDGPRPPEAGPRDSQRRQPGGGAVPPMEAAPRDGQRQQPPSPGGRDDRPRDPERRLQELEAKLDRIMQMLESRPGRGVAATPGMPPGNRQEEPNQSLFGGRGGVPQPPGAPGGFTPPGGMRGPGTGFDSGQPFGPGRGFGGGMSTGRGMGMGMGPGMGRPGQAPDGAEDVLRGIELNAEQRERIEHAMKDLQVETQKLEAEQARLMQEIQRRREEVERKRMEIIQQVLSTEQRERLQQRGPGGERPRERGGAGQGSGRGDGRGSGRGDGRGEGADERGTDGRGGADRNRDATQPRRDGGPERSPDNFRGRDGSGPDRPREATEPRRGPDRERPSDSEPSREREPERPREEAGLNPDVFSFFVGMFR